jgi:hypothetical protein
MKDVMAALYAFWSQFGIPAYAEDMVPDGATVPYIRYTVSKAPAMQTAFLTAYNYHSKRLIGNVERVEIAGRIADAIPEKGVKLPLDGGGYLFRGVVVHVGQNLCQLHVLRLIGPLAIAGGVKAAHGAHIYDVALLQPLGYLFYQQLSGQLGFGHVQGGATGGLSHDVGIYGGAVGDHAGGVSLLLGGGVHGHHLLDFEFQLLHIGDFNRGASVGELSRLSFLTGAPQFTYRGYWGLGFTFTHRTASGCSLPRWRA